MCLSPHHHQVNRIVKIVIYLARMYLAFEIIYSHINNLKTLISDYLVYSYPQHHEYD